MLAAGPTPRNPFAWDFARNGSGAPSDALAPLRPLMAANRALGLGVGYALTLALLACIWRRSPRAFRPYSRMLLLAAATDALLLLCFSANRVTPILNDGVLLLGFQLPWPEASYGARLAGCAITMTGLVTVCTALPAQYYFRYRTIVLRAPPAAPLTAALFLLALLFAGVDGVLCYRLYRHSARPGFNYARLFYAQRPVPPLLVADNRHYTSKVFFTYNILVALSSFGLTLYIGVKTFAATKQARNHMSRKTAKMQRQLTNVLIVQTIIPLATAILPFLVVSAANMLRWDINLVLVGLLEAHQWIPALNSGFTLAAVRPYRWALLRVCGRAPADDSFARNSTAERSLQPLRTASNVEDL